MTTTETASRSYSVPEFTMGDRIRRARMNAGYKQQDIEDETGISRNSITAWEHDARMPSAALLRVLANYLNVPVEWIIQGTTPTNTPTVAYLESTLPLWEVEPSKVERCAARRVFDVVPDADRGGTRLMLNRQSCTTRGAQRK
jgi:transcriptional regulator with XRE-family HTH domain